MTCALCTAHTDQPGYVRRDGWDCGPLVPLCGSCFALPIRMAWDHLAEPSPDPGAWKPVHLSFTRPGVSDVSPIVVSKRSDVRVMSHA